MHVLCENCQHVNEFTNERPRFCGYCGKTLATGSTNTALPTAPALLIEPTREFDPHGETLAGPAEGPAIARVPEQIGGYRLIRHLGAGGMGSVYEGEHLTTDQHVAVKLINPEFLSSPQTIERFRLEGRLASSLAHPRCVFVLAADEEGGQPYIIMELMPGNTLADLVKEQGPLPTARAIERMLDVIEGLQEAHRLGMIHRDVKPSNCFLDIDGRVKVGDFGLAKQQANEGDLTRTGSFIGTVLFASPEQIKRQPLDHQADVYSVAATLYFLLTGRAPFHDVDLDSVGAMARIVSESPPAMRKFRPEIPETLDRVVLRGLETEKAKRWADLSSFHLALLPFLPGQLSVGGLGYRFGAFAFDIVVLFVAMSVARLTFATLFGELSIDPLDQSFFETVLRGMSLTLGSWLLYFGVLEGLLGFTPGKWVFGLRVRAANGVDDPQWWQTFIRALSFYFIWYIDNSMLLATGLYLQSRGKLDLTAAALVTVVTVVGQLAAVTLPIVTMRRRNGYRGPHELLSGTRVVQIPMPEREFSFARVEYEPPLRKFAELPEHVGPFRVLGAWNWTDAEKTLIGEDPALGRRVLIWIRPASEPPLEPQRRTIARPTRLRWVAAGLSDIGGEVQWDAFLAPTGVPLALMIRQTGPVSWSEALPLLQQVADELDTSLREGTLPPVLCSQQVWVNAHGRVQLLGGLYYRLDGEPPARDFADLDQRALNLLAETSSLLLEGKAGALDARRPVRAPLPRQASATLSRLWGIGEPLTEVASARSALRELRRQPTEVTRQRRLVHLGVLSLLLLAALSPFLAVALFSSFFAHFYTAIAFDEHGRQLDHARDMDLVAWSAFPAPGPLSAAPAVVFLNDLNMARDLGQRRTEHQHLMDERQRWSNFALRRMIRQQAQLHKVQVERNKPERLPYNPSIREAIGEDLALDPFEMERGITYVALIWFLVAAATWIVWAFLTRGGLSHRYTGIELVRADGRRAARWQCLLRALLFWMPLVALIGVSCSLDAEYWSRWNEEAWQGRTWMPLLAWIFSWLAAGTLLSYFLLALWRPQRSWHDIISGTWLVPR
jgi:hypothetical protein